MMVFDVYPYMLVIRSMLIEAIGRHKQRAQSEYHVSTHLAMQSASFTTQRLKVPFLDPSFKGHRHSFKA
jgi:hypothetical protein